MGARGRPNKDALAQGELTERPKVTVLKTVVAQTTVGSNPTLSALCSLVQGSGSLDHCLETSHSQA